MYWIDLECYYGTEPMEDLFCDRCETCKYSMVEIYYITTA